MTATIKRLSAGSGYTYLIRQTAAADSTSLGRNQLADYYSEKGERPGQWWGSGLEGLDGIEAGEQVTEAQMRALFGEGMHPNAEQMEPELRAQGFGARRIRSELLLGRGFPKMKPPAMREAVAAAFREWNRDRGEAANATIPDEVRSEIRTRVARDFFVAEYHRAPLDAAELTTFVTERDAQEKRAAVAGFDVTFSPVKSVSALWAIASPEVAEQVRQAHEAAVSQALEWMEHESIYTREGTRGIAQVDARGMIATRFTHRDNRSSEPDLHTHVAIANRVQAANDGGWRTLDSRMMYRTTVAASERYNSAVEAELNKRLGITFAPREDMMRGRKQVVREVVGMPPELLAEWSQRTRRIDQRREELAHQFTLTHGRVPTPVEVLALNQQANLDTREAKHEPRSELEQRTEWRRQAERLLGSSEAVEQTQQRVLSAGARHARELSDDEVQSVARDAIEATQLRRAMFQPTHLRAEIERQVRAMDVGPDAQTATVDAVMDAALNRADVVRVARPDPVAEPEVLRRRDGQSIYQVAHSTKYTTTEQLAREQAIVAAAHRTDGRRTTDLDVEIALLESSANGVQLNPGQSRMVEDMATSGARVQLALAPAGSGKTTAMGVLSRAWENSGGTVLGLAPSAAAATELGKSIGVTTEVLDQLTTRLDNGVALPAWAENVGPDTLVLIDEAGMASTRHLHQSIEFALDRGASVRLIGDDRQLASVTAGGVLRDIQESVGAIELREVMRFRDPAEALALDRLRDGDAEGLGYYLDRERVHVTAHGSNHLDAAFEAWRTDQRNGLRSVMLASTNESVTALNERARAHRLETQGNPEGPSVTLRGGVEASAGDAIITRRNNRELRFGTDWVHNGARWTVQEVHPDGSLTARHDGARALVKLPADYVREHVDLGYAATIHTAQGSTVDVTRLALSGAETRQLLYVGLSRGAQETHVYMAGGVEGDPHEVIDPSYTEPDSPLAVLEAIVARDGAPTSATTAAREDNAPATVLGRVAPLYDDATARLATTLLTPQRRAAIAQAADKMVADYWHETHQSDDEAPELSTDPGWPRLLGQLALIEASGEDCLPVLNTAIRSREIDTAERLPAILEYRLDPEQKMGAGTGPLPWLPAVPEALAQHDTFGPYLAQRADQINDTAHELRDQMYTTQADKLPTWAAPFAHDRDLVADLAVFRAAQQVPDTDTTPTGPDVPVVRIRRHQDNLTQRADQARQHTPAAADWAEHLTSRDLDRVLDDPYWPTLATYLDEHTHGPATVADVAQALETALDQPRPLPTNHAASALFFRVSSLLDTTTDETPDNDTDTELEALITRSKRTNPTHTSTTSTTTNTDAAERLAQVEDALRRARNAAQTLNDDNHPTIDHNDTPRHEQRGPRL